MGWGSCSGLGPVWPFRSRSRRLSCPIHSVVEKGPNFNSWVLTGTMRPGRWLTLPPAQIEQGCAEIAQDGSKQFFSLHLHFDVFPVPLRGHPHLLGAGPEP